MKIINENYAYKADSHNLILLKSTGENEWENVGYYSSLQGLLNGLAKKSIFDNIEDVQEIKKLLESFKSWVKENVSERSFIDA